MQRKPIANICFHAEFQAVEGDVTSEQLVVRRYLWKKIRPLGSDTPDWQAIAVAAEQLMLKVNWFVTRFATGCKAKSQLNCYEFMKRVVCL
ncbi:hypothetical protein [Paraburkholderia hiiakae]|uniref:hypothetical protein n=1 Tax=Paraburkholderia hiiakae TaxID=1081782 RepID=UPI001917AD1B|nr:hypothetical protein [Paraburkholderia hiiakae]